jgi:HEPN domain-containing protein
VVTKPNCAGGTTLDEALLELRESRSDTMNGYPDTLRPGDHLRLAEDFFQAYRDLPNRPPPQSWPRYLVLCHAVELALKAYLFRHGATPKELRARTVRHNINELLTRATNNGLSLSPTVQSDISLLHEAHEKFWHRYPKEEATPVYTIEQFESPARELLKAVETAVYSTATPSP